jgi:hypothetical protein
MAEVSGRASFDFPRNRWPASAVIFFFHFDIGFSRRLSPLLALGERGLFEGTRRVFNFFCIAPTVTRIDIDMRFRSRMAKAKCVPARGGL